MNRDIAKAYHPLEALAQTGSKLSLVLQEHERVPAVLRHPEFVNAHEMHGKIDRGLTSTLKIQDGRVLTGQVPAQDGRVIAILFADSLETALNRACLV